jgi:hypothetical protein
MSGGARAEAKADHRRAGRQALGLGSGVRTGDAQGPADPFQIDAAVRHDDDRRRARRRQAMDPCEGEVVLERAGKRKPAMVTDRLSQHPALLASLAGQAGLAVSFNTSA